ncbi:MAG TPA: phosphonatase-like hydrolase [Blastocatellia bacterium]|nr:phosphonatase-like hydrolase [Blastocatellia bacterium]HMX26401.1 phosphonatase-like hydrolase [Blastocatellia bacterium]HNG34827.1 phosphonatase-like hydrolase [Blastocatellia bacterium]
MQELELVIFDLAGTTVQDGGQVPQAFTSALAAHGLVVTPEQLHQVRGASKRQAVLHFIPDGPERLARAEQVYATFRTQLAEAYQQSGVAPVAGAEQTFAWLRARDIRIALNTGFDREITALLLAALGWDQGVADAVVCGDDVSQGRPAPYLIFHALEATGVQSVHRTANVGDTSLDLQAGHHAGVGWNIGVLSGAHDRATLSAAPHTHLLASVADLPGLGEIISRSTSA